LVTKIESFDYSNVFSKDDSGSIIFSKEAFDNSATEFPNRILPSKKKILGEDSNAFQFFQPVDAIDLDFGYGEISKIATESNDDRRIIAWQHQGVSYLSVGTQTFRADSGGAFVTGDGQLFSTPAYLTEQYGCQHTFGVVATPQGYIWADVDRRRVFRIGPGGSGWSDLSTGKMATFFERELKDLAAIDNPLYYGGIHGAYDYEHGQTILTKKYNASAISQDLDIESVNGVNEWTLSFSDRINGWPSFYSFKPYIFVSVKGNYLLSQDPQIQLGVDRKVWRHFADSTAFNSFYGNELISESSVLFAVNAGAGDLTKVISHFHANQYQPWDSIVITTNRINNAFGEWYRLRGSGDIRDYESNRALYWEPRAGKWQGPAPVATDIYQNGEWLTNNVLRPLQGEQFFINLLTGSSEYRDLLVITTFFHPSRINH
jgi:hypothetical protein